MKKLWLAGLAALTSIALLVLAGSAQASSGKFCGATDARLGYYVEPGKICAWWPAATSFVRSDWWVRSAGSGVVCVAILQYPWPNGQAQPLNDQGQPSNWNCAQLRSGNNPNWNVVARPWVQNGFGAVYGQAAILNFSTARIQVGNSYNNWVHF